MSNLSEHVTNFVCGICGKMRDVHNLTEIQVCWESSNNQARETRQGIRAAHNVLDVQNVPREDVVWDGAIQNVTTFPVHERILKFAQAWIEERQYFDVRAAGRHGFRTGLVHSEHNPYKDMLDTEEGRKSYKHWKAGWFEARELANA